MATGKVACVVRCLDGVVRVGDCVVAGELGDGSRVQLECNVVGIDRYGRNVDFVDPPHSARITLDGAELVKVGEMAKLYLSTAD